MDDNNDEYNENSIDDHHCCNDGYGEDKEYEAAADDDDDYIDVSLAQDGSVMKLQILRVPSEQEENRRRIFVFHHHNMEILLTFIMLVRFWIQLLSYINSIRVMRVIRENYMMLVLLLLLLVDTTLVGDVRP